MSRSAAGKLLVSALLAGLVAAYFLFDLGRFFSLDYLKQSREQFQALYGAHTFLVLGAYFLIYVAVAALGLPAAAVLTLAGGALFGLWVGLVMVSLASTLGASLAFLLSRYVLRESVRSRFGDKLGRIDRGVEREGAFYLFTLRLIPIFPFFVVNTLMGLTPMRLVTYAWVSQVGMLPGTAVYVNAGKELGQLDSLTGLLSPSLILSFVVLGLFPLAAKKGLGWYRKRRNHG
ncbi:TVP38/TMEM64 family protein [uncultured Pseudodesulfovibrio sp.]|uniref:TVP38/TMEM64 family protein n=1 Tax=uncultured Pseudodesulfovibrio sp. TaxID=2035858 RepID=UPI0029C7EF3E|nr:TVP38/TMEM64 family protein [uncultured Pseudodesulfovibrio sp.]